MIAPPPVRRHEREWWMRIGAYATTVPAGAVSAGFLLHLAGRVFWHTPMPVIGVLALVTAMIGSGILPVRLPSSRWLVPDSWARFGQTAFSGLFGAALGLHVLTSISSNGSYFLLAWATTAAPWSSVWPVFFTFGVARSLPLVLIAFAARARRQYPAELLASFTRWTLLGLPGEIILLSALSILLLLPAGLHSVG